MRHIEDSLQMAVIRIWRNLFSEYGDKLGIDDLEDWEMLLHHSPNGGKRNTREAMRFKALGVRAGFPDLFLCVGNRDYRGLFIELKALSGTQSKPQKRFQRLAILMGYRYEVVRDLEICRNLFIEHLENYGKDN
jgi:hypothetical protein